MKKSLRAALVLVALSIALGFTAAGLAQQVGGYKKVATDDEGVVSAADFAIGEQSQSQGVTIKLVSIEGAERQVVAGINYRLCLKVEAEGADAPQEVKTVVYRNLQNEYSLKSWEDGGCE